MKNKENRYKKTFENLKKENKIAFAPFWILNYPTEKKSLEIIEKLAENSDILELGIPFSDPAADGPIIESADKLALKKGSTVKKSFNVIEKIRKKFPQKPIGLLVYFNLILAYGVEDFFKKCNSVGVDSVLVPEVSIDEIDRNIEGIKNNSLKYFTEKYNVNLVFIVSTNTSEERRKKIYEFSKSFLYVVSSPSVTGLKSSLNNKTDKIIKKIKKETEIPIAIGFGISKIEDIKRLKKENADGAIIGSEFFRIYEKKGVDGIEEFSKKCYESR